MRISQPSETQDFQHEAFALGTEMRSISRLYIHILVGKGEKEQEGGMPSPSKETLKKLLASFLCTSCWPEWLTWWYLAVRKAGKEYLLGVTLLPAKAQQGEKRN